MFLHLLHVLCGAMGCVFSEVYVGDLAPVLRACHARLADCRSVVAFSTEAPPRSGSANEHESALAEAANGANQGRITHFKQATIRKSPNNEEA